MTKLVKPHIITRSIGNQTEISFTQRGIKCDIFVSIYIREVDSYCLTFNCDVRTNIFQRLCDTSRISNERSVSLVELPFAAEGEAGFDPLPV